MAYLQDYALALGSGKAGLTDLRAQLVDSAGTNVGAAVSSGFVDMGAGNYLWSYAGFPDGHRGGVRFYSAAAAGATLTFAAINPEDLGDPLTNQVPGAYPSGSAGAALGRLGTAAVAVSSPIADGGDVSVVRGDSYTAALARALEWTDSGGTWPDLTAAAVSMEVDDGRLVAAGTVVTATGSNKKVRVELTSEQTNLLLEGSAAYDLVVTLGADRMTLVTGTVTAAGRADS